MRFLRKIKQDRIAAYASESTLFIIMSFVPFTILLITLLKYTPITEEWLTAAVAQITPDAFDATFVSLIHQMYSSVNLTAYVLLILSILWTVGKGFHSLVDGLNSAYHIEDRRNWFLIRAISILYTLIFIVVIILVLGLYVWGHTIRDYLVGAYPFLDSIFESVLQFRILIVVALLTLFFTLAYILLPRRRHRFRATVPGAAVAAIGWTGFSYFFSLYVEYSKNIVLIYGSLTTIVCTMLWLYTCMYIFLVGAEVNVVLERELQRFHARKRKEKEAKEKHVEKN